MSLAPSLSHFNITYSARWWSFTTSVRSLVEAICGHSNPDSEFAQKVGMAAHELLENAIKYSASPDALVSCDVSVEGEQLVLRVQNPANPASLDSLRREFDFVNAGDPLENYIAKMQIEQENHASQLGLARIRFEAGVPLALSVNGQHVTMQVTFDLAERDADHA